MLKFHACAPLLAAVTLAGLAPVPAHAAVLGPAAARCAADDSAVLVNVTGLRTRTGRLRVQLYASNARYLEKDAYLARVDVAVPASGPAQVCVPVSRAGRYVVSVRHDVNGNGRTDMRDGGGFSGNPRLSLTDVITKRKPGLTRVTFEVGATTREINVVLNYVRGTSVAPVT